MCNHHQTAGVAPRSFAARYGFTGPSKTKPTCCQASTGRLCGSDHSLCSSAYIPRKKTSLPFVLHYHAGTRYLSRRNCATFRWLSPYTCHSTITPAPYTACLVDRNRNQLLEDLGRCSDSAWNRLRLRVVLPTGKGVSVSSLFAPSLPPPIHRNSVWYCPSGRSASTYLGIRRVYLRRSFNRSHRHCQGTPL